MKVSTIDGGFRGARLRLGSLSTEQRLDASAALTRELELTNAVMDRLVAQANDGTVSQIDLATLRVEHAGLRARADAYVSRVHTIEGEAQLVEWRSTASEIQQQLAAFRRRVSLVTGDSIVVEPWKIGLAIAGAVVVVGGIGWAMSNRRSRRR